ncbi:site-specific integrase [Pseudoroseomonas cervicalis]|uniref:tyrosine-type recombinase/integrase n=1 Tax=Teichococcus cervicalis TaxID=204525 RepID=UPI0027862443|nr:site-specific integrase [Pseudoroseomonas cervicalis]MDQ1081473.1 integrase [Pseudoroseomonas cervicalis]
MPKLTEKAVAAFAIPPGKREAWLSDVEVPGLRLRATAGAKTFYACWTNRATGERQREKLGLWGALTVEQARTAARATFGKVAAGGDPAAERAARAADHAKRKAEAALTATEAAFTLDLLIEDWETLHLATRRASYRAEATRALRHAFKAHLEAPAKALDHAAVLGVIDRLAKAGKATTGGLVLRYGSACYGWAVKRRRLLTNPFAGLPMPERAGSRERVLSGQEVGEIWRAAGTMAAPYGPAMRFLLLTLARRDEVCGMRWREVSPDLSVWTQPGSRTKNGRGHVVPLSAPARALLRTVLDLARGAPAMLPDPDQLVFGSPTAKGMRPISGHSWVKRTLDAAIAAERAQLATVTGCQAETMPPWVLHDFRRAGVTWLAGERFPPHVADKLLNHSSGTISGVAAVYQRNDFMPERTAALEAWGAHVQAQGERWPSGQQPDAVALAIAGPNQDGPHALMAARQAKGAPRRQRAPR